MANSFKSYFLKDANTTSQNVYSAGVGVQATIIGMTVANTTDAPVSANVSVHSAGETYYMVQRATVAPGGALVPIGGDQKLVLEAGDYMQVSSTGNTDVIVSVLEIT